jgi:glutathione S-transferase
MDTPGLTLVIGNRNYSSWSLRPWLLMRHLGIPFRERVLPLFGDAFRTEIAKVSPAGRVPVLLDGDFAVWDTLAIVEYLAERFPALSVWPEDARARARARSVCAEMHSGFGHLRGQMPVNIEARLPGRGWNVQVQADVDRIVGMWSELRAQHAAAGPFLFGRFSAADAFYAPVVSRFETYAVDTPAPCDAYRRTILALPAMREWTEAALAERTFLAEDEPYRRSRD